MAIKSRYNSYIADQLKAVMLSKEKMIINEARVLYFVLFKNAYYAQEDVLLCTSLSLVFTYKFIALQRFQIAIIIIAANRKS